ncbi:hypothetical protein OSTOST_12064 [Ostertagia ostertagi]
MDFPISFRKSQQSSAVANPQMAGKNQATKTAPHQNAPRPGLPGPEFYTYVSREKIRALVVLSELDVEKFIRLLEVECVLIHYKVPDHLRKFMIQAVKDCIDKRILAKTTKA